MMGGVGFIMPPEELEREMGAALEADVAALEGGERVRAELVTGNAVEEISRRSTDADLLVMGSRGYGPRRAVLLGGVSGRVVREASCPVVVVPRGVSAHVEDLLGDSAGMTRAAAETPS
jgi:nucleotide-binding universal stress UspA family protein